MTKWQISGLFRQKCLNHIVLMAIFCGKFMNELVYDCKLGLKIKIIESLGGYTLQINNKMVIFDKNRIRITLSHDHILWRIKKVGFLAKKAKFSLILSFSNRNELLFYVRLFFSYMSFSSQIDDSIFTHFIDFTKNMHNKSSVISPLFLSKKTIFCNRVVFQQELQWYISLLFLFLLF